MMLSKKEEIIQAALRKVLTVAHHDFEKGLKVHAFFKLNNQTLGGDLVQDTFIKTWAYLVRGGKIEIMKAFLYHVLNNLIVDEYRKRKTSSLETLLEKGFQPSTDEGDRQINILDGKTATLQIAQLPENHSDEIRPNADLTRDFPNYRPI